MSRCPGVTYEFVGYDPNELVRRDVFGRLAPRVKIVVLYDGLTRQLPENRWRQHTHGVPGGQGAQPWADTVTGVRVVWSRRKVTDWWLSVREALLIAGHRPLYNIVLNKGNPRRVPPWEAVRLRRERDRLGGTARLVEMAKCPAEKGIRVANGEIVERYGTKV